MRDRCRDHFDGLLLAALALALLTLPAAASAQVVIEGTSEIDFDRPEAWAMKYFASVARPGVFGAPESLDAGQVDISLEYGQVPSLDEDERRVGFNGTKLEDLNKTPYLVRPVVRVGLGKKLSLAGSWIPPVERNGAEANIFTLTLARPLHEAERWRLGLSLFGQAGKVEGDFTCSEQTVAAGADPVRNPFGCEAPSRDEYELETVGLELSASWQIGASGRWEPHAAVSFQHLDLETQVNARYSGLLDRTRLVTDGETWSATAGLTYRFTERWALSGEIQYAPLDVVRPPSTSTETDELVHLRAGLRYRIR